MKHLYICRHGQSELNAQQIYAGQIDTPLTDHGREQAEAAGIQAADLGITKIVASSLGRAQETAQIIASAIDYPHQDITTSELFIERSYGSMEGQTWAVDAADFNDMESQESLKARAVAGLDYLKTFEAETILLVGHGSFFVALQEVLQPDAGPISELDNAHIVQLF